VRCLALNRDDESGSNTLPIFSVATKLDVPIYSQVGLRAGRCPKVAHTADNRRYQVDAILAYETAVMRDPYAELDFARQNPFSKRHRSVSNPLHVFD